MFGATGRGAPSARAVRAGGCAAILPGIAAADFPPSAGVRAAPLPFLKHYARPVCLAWNPRLPAVRAEAATVLEGVAKCLLDLPETGLAEKRTPNSARR